ncbi:MAG: [FeFe] hydrogenase H-cluster radical SAM maturase HydE [Oscillospiraceae bacterium]|nr:[FeFe] hydrogenase H-cluster radical SAM maturase HydE [Oscillospiraceae bacterium]
MEQLIEKLASTHDLTDDELRCLIEDGSCDDLLFQKAEALRQQIYGKDVYVRGLIEISNYCKNNCYYCGIRRDNRQVDRYRLTPEQILECCAEGYDLGFRTFVLQGGEDPYFTDDLLCALLKTIKSRYPDCAVTLSLGERSRDSYQRLYDAGADRYLLRHETASPAHYNKLHPQELSLENRQRCLFQLKEIGYQVGSGFMVGSPYQTTDCLIADLRFLQQLQPAMIGIGPFLTHQDTPFREFENGNTQLVLRMIAILRLLFPYALLPSTTALGTADPLGREKGIKAGANVVMPNLSPVSVRKKYELYDNKICTGDEAAECRMCLSRRMESIGYKIVVDRGDVKSPERTKTPS